MRPTFIVFLCFVAIFSREFSSSLMAWRRAGSESNVAMRVAVGITSLVDCPMLM